MHGVLADQGWPTLEIESEAKRRLADEYDAAQERGEVRTRADNQHVPDENKLKVTDLGLTRKQVHEARDPAHEAGTSSRGGMSLTEVRTV